MNVTDWHLARRGIVGGSELIALFGDEDGFVSEFELYHDKRGTLPKGETSDAMAWGTVLEPAVIEGLRSIYGKDVTAWQDVTAAHLTTLRPGVRTIATVRGILLNDGEGGGGTPDGLELVDGETRLVEIKVSSTWAMKAWPDEGRELPTGYLLQVWWYLDLLGLKHATLYVFVPEKRSIVPFEVEACPEMAQLIREKIAAFWARVAVGDEPTPNPERDADAVARQFRQTKHWGTQDRSYDAALCDLVAEYHAARKVRLTAEKAEDVKKTELLWRIGDAAQVIAGPLTVSAAGGRMTVKETRR